MIRREALPELLSPAGDLESLIAAVEGGADAVYIGGKSFSARAYARNFDLDGIRTAVRYCHVHGARLYVAINTLIYDRELKSAIEYAYELYRIGVDALICADLGLISELSRLIPDIELHASTQMGIHNTAGADEAAAMGIKRVVLARELSLENIKSITEGCSVETEVFLHGALCVCHSGQCLFSSLTGGRSGNRGECAQPCRLPYNGAYPLSLKDLSLASHIPELIESGVASLKIEGRMKSPDYVYRVTRIFRRLLDEGRSADRDELRELEAIFSRGGFTDGYLTGRIGKGMTGVRSDEDKSTTKELLPFVPIPKSRAVSGKIKILRGKPVTLELSLPDRSVTVEGDIPDEAISQPLDASSVSARIVKLGNTFLTLDPKDLSVELDSGLNVSPAALNDLRRRAAQALESPLREIPPISVSDFEQRCKTRSLIKRTALFLNSEEYSACRDKALEYFDISFVPLFSEALNEAADCKKLGAYIPPIITDSELPLVKKRLNELKNRGLLYTLVGNIGHLPLVRELDLDMIGDMRLNITNGKSADYLYGRGVESSILSPEITLPMARDISGGVISYGRIPLMLTERCFISENFGCDSCNSAALTDRIGMKFPMMREWQHRNVILNSVKTYMADKQEELRSFGIEHIHFIFSDESKDDIEAAIEAFVDRLAPRDPKSVRRVGSMTARVKNAEEHKAASASKAPKKRDTSPPGRDNMRPERGSKKPSISGGGRARAEGNQKRYGKKTQGRKGGR